MAAKPRSGPVRLAVDAGATRSRFALFVDPLHPQLVAPCRGFNYTLHGAGGLHALFSELAAGARGAEVETVGLATAGAGRADVRARALSDLGDALRRHFPVASLYLFHDGESALYRALGKGVGVVVAAGTGSIGFGRTADGREARAGGWGHLVGDEGSAHWIATRAIARALRSFDGRARDRGHAESAGGSRVGAGESGLELGASLTAAAGLQTPPELVSWLHSPERSKGEVAALARIVSDLAERGDAAAQAICTEAGAELALLALAVSGRLGSGSSPEVGLTGGVLTNSAPVREATVASILSTMPDARITVSSREPELGAALLLHDRAGSAPPDLHAPAARTG